MSADILQSLDAIGALGLGAIVLKWSLSKIDKLVDTVGQFAVAMEKIADRLDRLEREK